METGTQPERCWDKTEKLLKGEPLAPAPQEAPAQQFPALKAVSSGAIEGPDGFTIQIENSKGAYQPEWIAFRDLIIRSVNRDPAFQKLVKTLSDLCGFLNVTPLKLNEGDSMTLSMLTDSAREALRLAREGEKGW